MKNEMSDLTKFLYKKIIDKVEYFAAKGNKWDIEHNQAEFKELLLEYGDACRQEKKERYDTKETETSSNVR